MVLAAVHLLPVQQGAPAVPHAAQTLLELHAVFGSRHALPPDVDEQHG
jgi:hypothetical protein